VSEAQDEQIVFENKACLVLNKRAGLSSQNPGQQLSGGGSLLLPVHRLDMPVTGCLLLAKTREAAAFLSSAFSGSLVEKRYWAIVESPDRNDLPESAELIHWLRFDRDKNKSFAKENEERGCKKAVLRYCIAGAGKNYLFLEIDLITGRHHQIRAQLAAKDIDLHIKGDLKYGARRSEQGGGIRLHAYSLTFPNPLAQNEKIEVKTLPPVMDALWTAFSQAMVVKTPGVIT